MNTGWVEVDLMPRRISDYPDAFAGWNLISSFGSIISVIATALFLYIVYEQLVYGKSVGRNPWLAPQFFYDLLQTLLNRAYNSLEWALNSPPKPHPFVNLPLQSGMPQLVPFYFINQVVFGFTLLVVLIYAFSKFILPRFVRLSLSRIFIIKLNSLPKPHPFVNLPLQSGMPQLVPFYFINQVVFGFTLLVVLIYAFSKFILPRFVRLSLSRIFIIKLW